uniref:Putative tail protein n=1 Tax=viral metagenome TaxID=1070528 RepID=A0A6M3LG78_9ZZZZ
MALVMTVEYGDGSATANSYCALATADDYHDSRLHVADWSSAVTATKEAALVWSTRLMDDLLAWNGWKYTETQALEWPRDGVYDKSGYEIDVDEIPTFLQNATAEFARTLIVSDRTAEAATRGFNFLQAGSLKMSINKMDRIDVLPDSVWAMVKFCSTKALAQIRYLVRA